MKTEQRILNLSKDGAIQCYKWENTQRKDPKGIVLIVHGMAEHIERYVDFIKILTDQGFVVFGHNQRGHKGSISSKENYGYLGDFISFETLVSDVNEIVELVKSEYPNLPTFYLATVWVRLLYSVFVNYMAKKINGVILSGAMKNSMFLLKMGSFLQLLLALLKV